MVTALGDEETVDREDQPVSAESAVGPSSFWSNRWEGRESLYPWFVGLVLALVILGPALAPGPLFNLDLILPSALSVPRGAWGLGPELPRRVPVWTFVAWLSPILGAANVGKFLMVASIVVAFAGAYRLAVAHGLFVGFVAGALYAIGPFMLTRLAIGHLMVALPMAVLPWVLPRLLRPGDDIWATFLSVLALSVSGHYGGTVSGLVVLVGLCATRGRNGLRVVGVALVAQLPWLVPGLVVYSQGASIVDAAPFSTYAESLGDLGRVLAGHGFWQPLYQVGWPGGWPVLLSGLILTALAIAGTRDLPDPIARSMAALAAIGLFMAMANSLPGISGPYAWASRTAIGSVLREGHRVLPLYLVWMAPAAALGAQRLGRMLFDPSSFLPSDAPGRELQKRAQKSASAPWAAAGAVLQTLPLALAVILALPGVWGISPALRPVELPPEWAQAREVITTQPGAVLALPWHQYYNLEVDGIRRVLNPLPLFLGGDIITSSDPELNQAERKEHVDPREAHVDRILALARKGEPISVPLAKAGVRWVILLHEVDWLDYGSFGADPGLRQTLHGPSLDLYEVRGWTGLVVDADGQVVPSQPVVEPLLRLDASGPATYQRPGSPGWMRGLSSAGLTPEGTISLPAGSGPVWYWPALLVLLADFFTLGFVVIALRSRRRARHAVGQMT